MNISRDHAFRLRYNIHQWTQDAIIAEAVAGGYTSKIQPFWLKYDVRSLDRDSIVGSYATEKAPGDFFYRLDPRAAWYWEDNGVALLVKPMIAEVGHLFTKVTRIKVFIQKPDMEIASHRDLMPGNNYRSIGGKYKPTVGVFNGTFVGHPNLHVEPNTRHRDQKYLNLKIPLSADPGNPGKPFIIDKDGQKEYLVSDDCFYFLNEYEIFHGCDAVNFYRGVIFVDGMLNMEALEAEPKLDFYGSLI